MSEVAMDALIDLLDDALDEIVGGDPTVYTEHERTAFRRCYEHWLLGGLHDEDIAFLRAQLSESDEQEEEQHAAQDQQQHHRTRGRRAREEG